MFPTFFKYKMKEVKSFLQIMKGKASKRDQDRIEGADKAIANLDKERKLYEQERLEALNGIDPDTKRYQPDKSDNQDISAI